MPLHFATKPKSPVVQSLVEPAPETILLTLPVAVEPYPETEVHQKTKEFIALYRLSEERELKAILRRMEEIRKYLVQVANDSYEDTKPAVLECEAGEVEFSPRQEVTEIPNPMALIHELTVKFGSQAAYSVVNIALMPLRKMLSEIELQPFVKKVPGARVLHAVRPK